MLDEKLGKISMSPLIEPGSRDPGPTPPCRAGLPPSPPRALGGLGGNTHNLQAKSRPAPLRGAKGGSLPGGKAVDASLDGPLAWRASV